MQTPKKSLSKSNSSEVPKRSSPIKSKSSRQISVTVPESGSGSSAYPGSKTPKNKSPKLTERKSPRSPVIEKKRPNRASELETQMAQLQEDLKKTKEQLASAEACKKKAEEEAEEAKKQSNDAMEKVEHVQQQMKDLSAADDDRVHKLCEIGKDRDRAWQSELEALQKQHSVDSAALSSAVTEVQKLKQQVEMLSSSKAAQTQTKQEEEEVTSSNLHVANDEMVETLALVSSLKEQLETSQKSEEEYRDLLEQAQVRLEITKTVIETLKSDGLEVTRTLDSAVTELNEHKARIHSLEEAIRSRDEVDLHAPTREQGECTLRTKLDLLKSEVKLLKETLEEMEVNHNEEQIKWLMQVQSTREEVERAKIQFGIRESDLRVTIKEAKCEVAGLKECIAEREAQLNHMRERLNSEKEGSRVQRSDMEVVNLRARLESEEKRLKDVIDENGLLKSEMEKKEAEMTKSQEATKAELQTARAAEKEALAKVRVVEEEADKNSRKASQVMEELEATQAANLEMETEFRRLRTQCDQWRKAAEAAAAMLTTGNNENLMERTRSFGPDNNSLGGKLLNSPFSDEMDEMSPKKKNNMLKKIGVLWKKGQK